MPDDYYLAQCISADFGMGRGIAVEFNRRFDTKRTLQEKYPDFFYQCSGGTCLLEGRVLNLVTKPWYWSKPTYLTLKAALRCMRDICMEHHIKKVAMPKIGCGLDRLEWCKVSQIIQKVFRDSDVEILVCGQRGITHPSPLEQPANDYER